LSAHESRLTADESRIDAHSDLLTKQGAKIETMREQLDRSNLDFGEVHEMFGRIISEHQHTASAITENAHATKLLAVTVDNRFREFRDDFDKRCVLKHQRVDETLARLERSEDRFDKQLDDMSENSKITYIKKLQSDIVDLKQDKTEHKAEVSYWRRYIIATVVGLVSLFIGALAAVMFDRLKPQPTPLPDPVPVQAPAKSR
jgi:uncharacterized coiled-coil protein SlyX